MRAASHSSVDALIELAHQNTPNALNACSTIIAHSVSYNPIERIMDELRQHVRLPRHSNRRDIRHKQQVTPLEVELANAYAAKEDVSVCRNVTASADNRRVLKYVSSDTRSQITR